MSEVNIDDVVVYLSLSQSMLQAGENMSEVTDHTVIKQVLNYMESGDSVELNTKLRDATIRLMQETQSRLKLSLPMVSEEMVSENTVEN